MDMKKIAVALIALLAVVCIIPSSDAASISDRPIGVQEFDNMKGGDIDFTVQSENSFSMTVIVTENGKTVTESTVEVVPGTNEISIHISDPSPGKHMYRVECLPIGEFDDSFNAFNVNVDVSKNILSNWVTYAVIIIVVIVIAIFAYMKIRDTPKNKPEMTFEELEAQRKAEMAEKGQKKQPKATAGSTERQKYLANKKKKE